MQQEIKKICVFCGSSKGNQKIYQEKAIALGHFLAQKNITLVFGGGNIGIMGALSKAVLEAKGNVIGVIPKRIYEMIGEVKLPELYVVEDMHERKSMMYDFSDAFIALPGGIGTLEEFFEVYTWYQLGYHLKPIGLLNINQYYQYLDAFLSHMIQEGFFKQAHRDYLLVESEPEILVNKLLDHKVEYIEKLK